ncbi:MAG: hypothetical protein CMK00_02110 [Planctomycetes bacterium]|nr:hypothetical protein [Planctomycetota bacterium]
MAWSEDNIHRWLSRQVKPSILRGSAGHDACVLTRPSGREVLCTDQVVLGVHCEVDSAPKAVGRKAAARALSDLAATAATPRALTLAVRAPAATSEAVIRGWVRGVMEEGDSFGAPLCGGDLSCSAGPASLCITASGEYPLRGKPPGRDRAKPGDCVVLTGPVGGSRLGRHLNIATRVEAGARLHFTHGAKAMMDVSDGLAWDLFRLCRASGVMGTITSVPIHSDARRASKQDGVSALSHALHDGEDHELIATLSAGRVRAALADPSPELSGLAVIGVISSGSGLRLSADVGGGSARRWTPREGGWRHGS